MVKKLFYFEKKRMRLFIDLFFWLAKNKDISITFADICPRILVVNIDHVFVMVQFIT